MAYKYERTKSGPVTDAELAELVQYIGSGELVSGPGELSNWLQTNVGVDKGRADAAVQKSYPGSLEHRDTARTERIKDDVTLTTAGGGDMNLLNQYNSAYASGVANPTYAGAVNPYLDPSATAEQSANWRAQLAPEQQYQYAQLADAQRLRTENTAQIDGLSAITNSWGQNLSGYNTQQQALGTRQTAADAQYAQYSQGLAQYQNALGAQANATDSASLGQYGNAIAGYQSQNNASMAALQQQYNQLATQLQSTTQWGGDLSSQAAGAYADPAAVQAQMQGLGMLSGSAGGALNVNYAGLDPNAYGNLNSAMSGLSGVSGGALDVNYSALDPNAYASVNNALNGLSSAANGGLNVDYQNLDRAAYLAQEQATNQLSYIGGGGMDTSADMLSPVNRSFQEAARGQMLDWSDGAHDLSLRGVAPEAYDNQMRAMQDSYGVFRGSQDISRDAEALDAQRATLGGMYNVYGGQLDAKVGDLDPEAYAAQKDALSQYSALTDPEVTDAERFIYEQERMGAEQTERANREANMSSLRQRGMGGSGMELTNTALANQQTSQNRLLGNLGANAQAVARSMQALAGYGSLSTDMVNNANALQSQNMDRRLTGLQGFGTQANVMQGDALAVNQANQATRMQGLGLNQQVGNNLVNQGMQIGEGNMDRRFAGLQGYAALSTDMLNQDAQFYQNNVNNRIAGAQGAGTLAQNSLGQQANVAMSNSQLQYQSLNSLGQLGNQSLGQQADVALANNNLRYQGMNSLGNMANQSLGQQAQVATANSNRQLDAQNAYTTQAGNARNSSFNEAFSRGSAADQTAQFNRNMSLDVSMFNDQFAQQERDASWGRSTGLNTAAQNTTAANAGMSNNLLTGQLGVNATSYGRGQDSLGAMDTANTRAWENTQAQTQRDQALIDSQRKAGTDILSAYSGLTGMRMENNGAATNATNGVWNSLAGSAAAETAQEAAIREAKASDPKTIWSAIGL